MIYVLLFVCFLVLINVLIIWILTLKQNLLEVPKQQKVNQLQDSANSPVSFMFHIWTGRHWICMQSAKKSLQAPKCCQTLNGLYLTGNSTDNCLMDSQQTIGHCVSCTQYSVFRQHPRLNQLSIYTGENNFDAIFRCVRHVKTQQEMVCFRLVTTTKRMKMASLSLPFVPPEFRQRVGIFYL